LRSDVEHVKRMERHILTVGVTSLSSGTSQSPHQL
jgi:hypothetical protein